MTKKSATTYTISELSSQFDITTRAIRFYESEQLLAPKREGQKRIYNQRDYVTLKLILRGKRLGWSLAESRNLIQMYDPKGSNEPQYSKVLKKINESRNRLKQQLNDIEIMMAELDEHEKRIHSVMQTKFK